MRHKLLLVSMLVLVTLGCTGWHGAATDLNISGQDIVYLKDERANLCYAVLFITNKAHTSVRTMGMTTVSCDSIKGVPAK